MFDKIISKVKGWWNKMFDYNKVIEDFGLDTETSKEMMDAIKLWTDIYNGRAQWINKDTKSLNVAKTVCNKVAKAVTLEFKSSCTDEYIDKVYQRFLKNIRKNTELALGKANMFFKPTFENGRIKVVAIQGDKFIPFKFDDTGELLGLIIVDQIVRGKDVYTRLEYNELIDTSLHIKNIAYKGRTNGVVLSNKIPLSSVDKWKDIQEVSQIDNIDRLIGGFFTMPNTNTIDNSSPLGVALFTDAIGTLKEIDKQFSRTLWEYEGSELAIDADATMFKKDKNGNPVLPKGKKRLYRTLNIDDEKNWNIFSPEIRDTALFNGLNELLRQAESEMGISFGVLSKMEQVALTATEIKASKQEYFVTVSDVQKNLQIALEDLIYGIYVLCKLYNIPVGNDYKISFDWDDSIIVDKDSIQKQAQLELNQDIIDKVEYFIITRNWSEEEAIAFIKKMEKRSPKQVEEEPPIEE